MIVGTVQQLEAVIKLNILDASNQVYEFQVVFQVVIDTGYNGSLTLPASIINKLGLPSIGSRRAMLADGSEVLLKNTMPQSSGTISPMKSASCNPKGGHSWAWDFSMDAG